MGGGDFYPVRAIAGAVILAAAALGGGTPALGQCEVQQLQSPIPGGNMFGSVAMDGDVAVVGDTLDSGGIGAAYVYRRQGLQWVQEGVLHCPEPSLDDNFGHDIAVRGDVIMVGASAANAPVQYSGAVYVYRYDPASSQWAYACRLTASDGAYNNRFGAAIALDDDVVLIGARRHMVNGHVYAGAAYVFRFNGSEWVEEFKLTKPDPMEEEYFGISVAMDGDVAVIGAHGTDHAGNLSGSAFAFRRDNGQWQCRQELRATDPAGMDRFGWAVALAGEVIAVGAPQDDGQTGSVHVFRHDGSEWALEARLTAADPVGPWPVFGWAVSLSSDETAILIGAPWDRCLGNDSGAAHLFRFASESREQWIEVAKLTGANTGAHDQFGGVVALHDDTALVGAQRWSLAPGRAYVFAGIKGLDCNDNTVADACDIFAGTSPDLNGNGIPDECEAIGDLNGDGTVNVLDLLDLLAAWGTCDDPCPPSCSGDLDGDCEVGFTDLVALLSNWGDLDRR